MLVLAIFDGTSKLTCDCLAFGGLAEAYLKRIFSLVKRS
jgi:hypothetical protein